MSSHAASGCIVDMREASTEKSHHAEDSEKAEPSLFFFGGRNRSRSWQLLEAAPFLLALLLMMPMPRPTWVVNLHMYHPCVTLTLSTCTHQRLMLDVYTPGSSFPVPGVYTVGIHRIRTPSNPPPPAYGPGGVFGRLHGGLGNKSRRIKCEERKGGGMLVCEH